MSNDRNFAQIDRVNREADKKSKTIKKEDGCSELIEKSRLVNRRSFLGTTGAGILGLAVSTPVSADDSVNPEGDVSPYNDSPYVTEFSGNCPDSPINYDYIGYHALHTDYQGVSPVDGGEEFVHVYNICDVGWAGRYWPGFPYNEDESDAEGAHYIHGHAVNWEPDNGNVYLPDDGNDDDVIGVIPAENEDADSTTYNQDIVDALKIIAGQVSGLGEVIDASEMMNIMLRDGSSGTNDRQWDYGTRSVYGTGRNLAQHFLQVRIICDPGEDATGRYDSKMDYHWRASDDRFHSQGVSYTFYTPNSTSELGDTSSNTAKSEKANERTVVIDGKERQLGPLMENPGEVTVTPDN